MLESLFKNVAGLQACNFIKKTLQHWCFPMYFVKFLRTPILKNICERLLLFVSPQNNITNSGGKFGLDETWTECKVSIFLNVTILFNQMQPCNLKFAKSRAMCAMRAMGASVVYVPTCQKRVNISFLRANLPINVPTCQKRANMPKKCQFFKLGYQRANRRASFSTIFQNKIFFNI